MKNLIKSLYDSEINVQIGFFWDMGFDCKFGDEINGFEAEVNSRNLDEFLTLIERKAKELYPDSKFAKEYDSKETFESVARPLMKYLGENHHPHTSAYISNIRAELLEGKETFGTEDYVSD